MSNDEYFDEFYAKLNDIVNSAYNLGEIYDQPKIVRKILRSLTENFRPKVTVITENKDVDSILVDELVGSPHSYELYMIGGDFMFLFLFLVSHCATLIIDLY